MTPQSNVSPRAAPVSTKGDETALHPSVRWGLRASGAAALVLGLVGFLADTAFQPRDVARATLQTLQLFVLNVPPGELKSAALWWAAFLAPLASVGAAVSGIAALRVQFRNRLRIWRLARQPATDLFLGGGETAAAIAARRLERRASGARQALVGLDLNGESALERTLRAADGRCYVVQGNALVPATLRQLNAAAAGHIWITSGDDYRNLAIARQVLSLQQQRRREGEPASQVLINLSDRHLIRARERIFGQLLDGSNVEFISLPRIAARLLLMKHPPVAAQPALVHIAIVGASRLAAALAVHAAQHCIYSERAQECVQITLIGAGTSALRERLYRQFPVLNPDISHAVAFGGLLPVARLQAHECDEAELTLNAWQQLQSVAPFGAVYVCAERDVDSLIAATRAAALRDAMATSQQPVAPIVTCIQQPGVDSLATSRAPGQIAAFGSFDVYAECIQPHEAYPGASADARAELINDTYAHGGVEAESVERTRERARAAWLPLPDEFRWSSRFSADHLDIKLQLLGVTDGSPEERAQQVEQLYRDPNDGVVERMKRLEHRRFVAERLMDGWLPVSPRVTGEHAPSGLERKQQRARLRLSHTLVPYDRLPEVDQQEDQQAKDEHIVRALPRLLRSAGPVVPARPEGDG
jgi:hypothetical protein